MSRLGRYWHLWRTLPLEERRERTAKLAERLLRQRPFMRRLRIAPDQPRWGQFRRALRVHPAELARRLRAANPRRGPLFVDLGPRIAAIAEAHPEHVDAVLETALSVLERRYDLLGAGPTRPLGPDGNIDWHLDWKSGHRWPSDVYHSDLIAVRGDGSDVKLPWELARCQHLILLAQAARLAPLRLGQDEASAFSRRCAREVREQIDHWIRANPRGLGIHWACAMEVAIRAVAWLACLAMLRESPELDDAFRARLVRSLWVHGLYIRRNLEIASDGTTSNHYLSDVIGLYALGCGLPELREARGWRDTGRTAIVCEMERQVHPDGVDFERSIPYHRLVTEIFLHGTLLARAAGDELPRGFLERLARMLEFTATYTRPDGSAAQWGDNDDGRLLPLSGYASHGPHDHRHLLALGGAILERGDLAEAAGGRSVERMWLVDPLPDRAPGVAAGSGSQGFPDAAYYVMREADLHATVPCGPVGTRGLGNHSHNDLFSLCVWAAGVEWITDPGTGCYTGQPELRNRLRSIAAHSTLQLGGREPNDLGAGLDGLFKLGERAAPRVLEWTTGPTVRLAASHTGFSDRDETWVHERSVQFSALSRTFTVTDKLWRQGSASRSATTESAHLRYALQPETEGHVLSTDEEWPDGLVAGLAGSGTDAAATRRFAVRLSARGASFWIGLALPVGSSVELTEGTYSPRYGVSLATRYVTATLPPASALTATSVLWSPAPRSGA